MCGYRLHRSAQAAVTSSTAWGLNHRTVSPHSPGGWASRVKESACFPPGLSPGLVPSLCLHQAFSLCLPTPSFYEVHCHTELGPTHMTSF